MTQRDAVEAEDDAKLKMILEEWQRDLRPWVVNSKDVVAKFQAQVHSDSDRLTKLEARQSQCEGHTRALQGQVDDLVKAKAFYQPFLDFLLSPGLGHSDLDRKRADR